MTRMQAITTARRMWDNGQGWTYTEIQRYLAEHGLQVHQTTVRTWVDDEYAQSRNRDERRRAKNREHHRRKRGSTQFLILDEDAKRRLGMQVAAEPPTKLTPELLLALRVEDKHTYPAIASIARRFFGESMTEHQVRDRLNSLGAPKNPKKARAARRQHAQLKAAA